VSAPIDLHRPRTPGLFVTGTDTEVGKTVASCLIADQMRRRSQDASPRSKIGVLKPVATGCRRDREGLVSPDAEQLAHAADFDPDIGDLTVVNPVRFRAPVAPAVALEQGGLASLEWEAIDRSLERLDEACERIVIEGVGGVMAPLEARGRRSIVTVLDLIVAIGYPVVVVCRADLGTLNHTAMTCALLRQAGARIAGLIVNGYEPDSTDGAMQTNRRWLARQSDVQILATLPGRLEGRSVAPRRSAAAWDVRAIPADLRAAIDVTDFASLCRPARSGAHS